MSEKMRVLFLAYTYPVPFETVLERAGSGCSWVDSLIDAIKTDRKVSLAIGVPVVDDQLLSKSIDGITIFGLPALLPSSFTQKIKAKITYAIEPEEINDFALKAIDLFKPSVVQVFGSENPFGLLSYRTDLPLIIHIQGILNIWKHKWFVALSPEEQFKYTSLFDLITKKRGLRYEYRLFLKRANREIDILQKCNYYMGRTGFDRRTLLSFNSEANYFHCEELIRSEFFEHKWKSHPGDEINCVSIIKGTSYKGIDLLIETARLLRDKGDFRIRFNVCGVSADEEIARMLKAKFKIDYEDLGIRFIGRLSVNGLIEQLCKADIYVHPSYIENSPNSVCEAMALGMPVISTNTGGVGDLITSGVDGLLVQEGEPYSMAGAIIEILRDYDHAGLMGINAAQKALERHEPGKTIRNLYSIYRAVIDR